LPGGELWIVIQKKQGAPSAIAKLDEMFKEVVTVKKDKGYFIIRAEKD
jgi:16S rRNA (guanine1207-N2)-methyltransferase